MRRTYLFYLFLLLGAFLTPSSVSASTHLEEFRSSLGFVFLDKQTCDTFNADSLLNTLHHRSTSQRYFEYGRLFIRSYLNQGCINKALDLNERLYNAAKEWDSSFGLALSFRSMAEINNYAKHEEDAQEPFELAYDLLSEMSEKKDPEHLHLHMLLVDITRYYITIQKWDRAEHYLKELDHFSASLKTPVGVATNAVCWLFYHMQRKNLKQAQQIIRQLNPLMGELPKELQRYIDLMQVRYQEATGAYEVALKGYDRYLATANGHNSHVTYKGIMAERCELLNLMNKDSLAYAAYGELIEFGHAAFSKTNTEEMAKLTATYKADLEHFNLNKVQLLQMELFKDSLLLLIVIIVVLVAIGWYTIFHLHYLTDKEEEARKAALQAVSRRNVFLSNMSHEVRTPLNAIVGFSTILAQNGNELSQEEAMEYAHIIQVNSYQLLKLINDILDYSDFNQEDFRFHLKPEDVVVLCREAVKTVIATGYVRPEVKMSFHTDLDKLVIQSDATRMRQILINLLTNAAKFTEKGTIVLELSLPDENTMQFTVTDTGCGIPIDKQEKIFERFEKLDNFVQGTGLGLSICKKIVEHYNGKIWVDASYTSGARFCVTRPLNIKEKGKKK